MFILLVEKENDNSNERTRSLQCDGESPVLVRRVQNRLNFRIVFPPNNVHHTSLELMPHFADRYWTLCRFACSLERQRQACSELPIYTASCLEVENCSSPVWKRVAPTTPLSSKREHRGRTERIRGRRRESERRKMERRNANEDEGFRIGDISLSPRGNEETSQEECYLNLLFWIARFFFIFETEK